MSYDRCSSDGLEIFFWHLLVNKIHKIKFLTQNISQVTKGTIDLSLGIDEVYTLTTLKTGVKGEYPDPPIQKPFPLPYTDDFECKYFMSNENS